MIDSKDISIVVQGAVDPVNTGKCIESIRKYLPQSKIILSTWEGSDISNFDYDVLVLSKDCGGVRHDFCSYTDSSHIINNCNRQLLSTRRGLNKVKTKYAIKLRTDSMLLNVNFLNYWDRFNKRKECIFFKHRILVSSLYSREYSCQSGYPTLFHPSDFYMFGLTEDLKDYFNCYDLQIDKELGNWQYKYPNRIPYNTQLWRYSPEQVFCVNWVKKHVKRLDFYDWSDWNSEKIKLSNTILYNNFIFLDKEQSGISSLKYSHLMAENSCNLIKGLINFRKFQERYKELCDPFYIIEQIETIKPIEPEVVDNINKNIDILKFKQHTKNFIDSFKFIFNKLREPFIISFYLLKIVISFFFNKFKSKKVFNRIKGQNVSIIVQGSVEKETFECLKSIRRYFPNSKIILSTWEGSNVDSCDCDIILFNKDPGFCYYNNTKDKLNNINRQIISTLAGLKECKTKYALKLRSDFILTGNNFLQFWNKFEKYNSKFKVFNNKILSCCFFSRNPRFKNTAYPFHPSDLVLFGETSDLIKLFNIPLMPKNEEKFIKYKDSYHCKYVPEQYIFINCLKNNNYKVNCHYFNNCNDVLISETENLFISNFIFLNFKQFNLLPPKQFSYNTIKQNIHLFYTCYTHIEYLKLYKNILNVNINIPKIDKDRFFLKILYIRYKMYKFLSNIAVLFIPNKILRKHLRNKIFTYLIS